MILCVLTTSILQDLEIAKRISKSYKLIHESLPFSNLENLPSVNQKPQTSLPSIDILAVDLLEDIANSISEFPLGIVFFKAF